MGLHLFSFQYLPLSLFHTSLFILFSMPYAFFLAAYHNPSLCESLLHFDFTFFVISSLFLSLHFCLCLSFVFPYSIGFLTIFPFHCLILCSFLLYSFISNEVWTNLNPDLGSLFHLLFASNYCSAYLTLLLFLSFSPPLFLYLFFFYLTLVCLLITLLPSSLPVIPFPNPLPSLIPT